MIETKSNLVELKKYNDIYEEMKTPKFEDLYQIFYNYLMFAINHTLNTKNEVGFGYISYTLFHPNKGKVIFNNITTPIIEGDQDKVSIPYNLDILQSHYFESVGNFHTHNINQKSSYFSINDLRNFDNLQEYTDYYIISNNGERINPFMEIEHLMYSCYNKELISVKNKNIIKYKLINRIHEFDVQFHKHVNKLFHNGIKKNELKTMAREYEEKWKKENFYSVQDIMKKNNDIQVIHFE